MTWLLITGNENKFLEAKAILAGRPLERLALDLPELQAPTTREVALEKAKAAFATVGKPVIVEDAGFEIAALGSFPGPFIKFWEKLGGLESICRALDAFPSRAATAVCVLGVCDANGARVVEGRVTGTVRKTPRGTNGFGWDAIFIPDGESRTFAEMTTEEKSAVSHRRAAWTALLRTL